MQYLYEIIDNVSSIDEFLNVSTIYNYVQKPKEVCLSKDVHPLTGEPIVTYNDKIFNKLFILPNGDYIVYLVTLYEDEFNGKLHISVDYEVIYLLKCNDPSSVYEVIPIKLSFTSEKGEGKSYKIKKIINTNHLKSAYNFIETILVVNHIKNVFRESTIANIADDIINYNNGALYIGSHNNGVRNKTGTFIMPHDFVLAGDWFDDGKPNTCTLIYGSCGNQESKKITFSNLYHDILYNIDFNHITRLISDKNNFRNNQDDSILNKITGVIMNKPDVKKLRFEKLVNLDNNTIIMNKYLVIANTMTVIPRKDIIEEYKFMDDGTFLWAKFVYKNIVIIRDINCLYTFEDGDIPKITIKLMFIRTNIDNIEIEIQTSFDSFKYMIKFDNEIIHDQIVEYSSNYDIINTLGKNLEVGYRVTNNMLYLEDTCSTGRNEINSITVCINPFSIIRTFNDTAGKPYSIEIDSLLTPKLQK